MKGGKSLIAIQQRFASAIEVQMHAFGCTGDFRHYKAGLKEEFNVEEK